MGIKYVLSYKPIVLQISLNAETFESNASSDWLNRMVKPGRGCVTFKLEHLAEMDQECSLEWLVKKVPSIIHRVQPD